jgi:hypothetical protein
LSILTFMNYNKKEEDEIYKLISCNSRIMGITFKNCHLTNLW